MRGSHTAQLCEAKRFCVALRNVRAAYRTRGAGMGCA